MSVTLPQPTVARIVSILWFPFFLAVAMSLLFMVPLAQPTPHDMRIGVTADEQITTGLQQRLDGAIPRGFVAEDLIPSQGAEAVRNGEVAAVVSTGADPQILVASSAGPTRAQYLTEFLPSVVAGQIVDIAPSAPGDATGTGVFFYALPIAIVGMVAAIVLLQLGAWTYRRKAVAVAVIAAFTSVVTYAIAVWQQVVVFNAQSALLMLATFVLVNAIGWALVGAAEFVRQFLVPVALTFVLVLGVPTAGAPVSSDMLPRALGALHEVMPMGQFITLVRSLAYGVGSPLQPILVLLAWLLVVAVLILLADRRHAAQQSTVHEDQVNGGASYEVRGTVTSLSGATVTDAMIRIVDADGDGMLQTRTTSDGAYTLSGVPGGVHHLLVTAEQAAPEIITVSIDGHDRHDFALQLWDDPAWNLTADEAGELR